MKKWARARIILEREAEIRETSPLKGNGEEERLPESRRGRRRSVLENLSLRNNLRWQSRGKLVFIFMGIKIG